MINYKHKTQLTQQFPTESQYLEQQQEDEDAIVIKNLDSGTHQVFDQTISQSFVLDQLDSSSQIKASLWNSYFQKHSNLQSKLLKMVLYKQYQKLFDLLSEEPIQLNVYTYMDGQTLLHNAVASSSVQIVKLLIEKGIKLDVPTNNMQITPLHPSVLMNKIQMVDVLIQAGSNPMIKNIDGNTVLHLCCDIGNIKIFSMIVQKSIFELNFQETNHQGVSIIESCRNYSFIQLIQQYCSNKQKQNKLSSNQIKCKINQRLFQKGQTFFNVYSRSDRIQKFIQIREQAQLFQSNKFPQSNQNQVQKKKNVTKRIRHSKWLQNVGSTIAGQSVEMMRQSMKNHSDVTKNMDSLANYDILRFIGSGGFAQVFLARKKKSTKVFAIKRISKQKIIQNKLKKYVYAEKNIMIKCQNEFIVQVYSAFQDSSFLYLVLEYCECGDLQKLIRSKLYFHQDKAKLYAAQIGLALQYIHHKNILFRDLKPANVLICSDGYLKISDFGLAKQSLISFSFLGSVDYLAPEMLVDNQMKEHTKAIDWYLFGVIIYQMLVGRPPFYHQNQVTHFSKIKNEKVSFPKFISLSQQCKHLLGLLLQKNSLKRIGSLQDFDQIKKHKWFQSVNWKLLQKKQLVIQKAEQIYNKDELRKKMEINQISVSQKYEYFKQWNYTPYLMK